MPRSKKSSNGNIGVGMSAKQMRRKKPINSDLMVDINPLTDNQKKFFDEYKNGKNMFAYGAAGTGKTFIALYHALRDVLDPETPYEKVYIVRSLVSTREIGFLPGDHEDKAALYQIPYKNMVKYMFELASDSDFEMLYGNLKAQETISFWSTSFIRGTTLDNAVVVVDEMQNLNFHELDSFLCFKITIQHLKVRISCHLEHILHHVLIRNLIQCRFIIMVAREKTNLSGRN